MVELQLPPLHQPSGYKTSYSYDYDCEGCKRPAVRLALQPTKSFRRNNPQPRHVFFFNRTSNEPVCRVRSPPNLSTQPSLVHSIATTCASSYSSPNDHPNFQNIPRRFGFGKLKPPAKGIVPVNVLTTIDFPDADKLFSSVVNTKPMKPKRRLNTPYVLDQRLPEYEAMADMKARAKTTKEPVRPVVRPSRRKLVHTHKPSFSGSSPLVRKRSPNVCSLKCCDITPRLYY